jgi:dipeptidyl aminopeptidase/acylaminoacyl peptidase
MNSTILAAAALSLSIPFTAAAQTASKAAEEKPGSGVVRKLIATTYGGQRLHLAGSDGRIQPFTLPEGTVWGSGGDGGSSDPVLSPDGTSVAYLRSGSLNIRPCAGGKATVAVSGYPHEEFLITGWSPDGASLVYFLGPPQSEDPPPSKITEPKHFVYDVKSKQSREIRIAGQLAGWLPDGAMLLWQDDGQRTVVRSQALHPGAAAKELLSTPDSLGQVVVSPEGTRIAAAVSPRNQTTTSQIASIELATGKRTPLREPAGWAEIQWPRWSPSGKHVSWQATVEMREGIPWNVVMVDSKPRTKPAELSGHYWLTDEVLAVVESNAIAVIEASTGKELGRRKFGKK